MKRRCFILVQILVIISSAFGIHAENFKDTAISKFELILPNLYIYRGAYNSYLIKSGSSTVLIDAGSETITEHLKEIGVRKIDWFLHIHYHRGQCLGDLRLKHKDASIAIGNNKKDILSPPGQTPPFAVPTKFLLNGELPDWGIRMAPIIKSGVDKVFSEGD